MRICAVIVTHNRPALLKRCVEAVLNQTAAPAAVIVIDNASTTAAADCLGVLATRVQVHRFPANTGGAGGFHYGLAETFRQGYDAAWLMDDDGQPETDCLEELVRAVELSSLGLAAPLVVDEANTDRLSFGLAEQSERRRVVWTVAQAREAGDSRGVIGGVANPFNGTLVTGEAYRSLGDIKFECFIWGDEEEYFWRALNRGIRVGTCTGAVQYHPAERSTFASCGPLRSRIRVCAPDRSHHYYRNLGHRTARYRGPATLIYLAASYVLYLLWIGKASEIRRFLAYYVDGARDRYALEPSRDELKSRLWSVSRVPVLQKALDPR